MFYNINLAGHIAKFYKYVAGTQFTAPVYHMISYLKKLLSNFQLSAHSNKINLPLATNITINDTKPILVDSLRPSVKYGSFKNTSSVRCHNAISFGQRRVNVNIATQLIVLPM